MSTTYYAELDASKTVLRVIVADAAFIAKMPGNWIETTMDGSVGKNYAGKGHAYDDVRQAFITPKPYPSFVMDEAKAQWKAPVDMPLDGAIYGWNESKQQWVKQ